LEKEREEWAEAERHRVEGCKGPVLWRVFSPRSHEGYEGSRRKDEGKTRAQGQRMKNLKLKDRLWKI
jgi:hypothetical protein